ncbi:5-methyltetrahydropteroyltriglutamate--homocysteine S-methyltransferase [Aeromicrobium sp. CTD01-1L150]|uniref:5-methyltetrahydropteroyltriglutamate-- homocysteine S-methyltransferase n=1 Tax=Aeromicrobium sp. CTD01-1L150 TaxID=3341830 RepID=UPI0035C117C5
MDASNSGPPFRADHVGSLLRPEPLLHAREEFTHGRLSADDLRAAEDQAISDVVALQADAGLRTVSDGEFRRASWHMDFIYAIGGINRTEGDIAVHFHNAEGDIDFTPSGLHVDEPVHIDEPIFGEHFTFLRDEAAKVSAELVPKLTVPSPSMVHYRGGRASIDPEVYPDEDVFWADLSAAYASQVRGVHALGGRYLQFDDTSLAYLNDPEQREHVRSIGGDAEHQHERYVEHINEALADKPDDMVVTTHMCRGNFRSSWAASGGYDFVAEAVFGGLDVDGFFAEWDDERSGGFEPLRYLAPGKRVVLGLVTTKSGELESPDDLKRRIDEAARYVDLDQLCLSPQCGFSSTVEGNSLTIDEQKAKLELIVSVATDVWGSL